MRARIDRKTGTVSVTPETFEDLWHIYKAFSSGAMVSARSTRKYKPPGSGKEERVNVFVVMEGEKAELHKHTGNLRITGKIAEIRPEGIAPLGSYHTIDVEVGKEIRITKEWKGHELDRISDAVKASRRTIVSIVVIDYDIATFASLRQYGVEFGLELHNRAKKADKGSETGEFFNEVAGEIGKIDGIIILGGPGFVKENLLKLIRERSPETAKRIHVVGSSNAEKSGVYEIIKNEEMYRILESESMHTLFMDIERFLKSVGRDDGLAAYGKSQLEAAAQRGAVARIVVVDSLVMGDASYETLIDAVKSSGGEVRIVPSESQAAEQVMAFGGAIALLRFRIK